MTHAARLDSLKANPRYLRFGQPMVQAIKSTVQAYQHMPDTLSPPATALPHPQLRSRQYVRSVLQCSMGHIDNEVKRGNLRPKLMGKKVCFTDAEIARYIDALPEWQPKAAR
jgi:hypothetical protein